MLQEFQALSHSQYRDSRHGRDSRQHGRRARRSRAAQAGSVAIEAALVFPLLLVLSLGCLQLLELLRAELLVQAANLRACRSAEVVFFDSPRYYGGEALGMSAPSSTRMKEVRRAASLLLLSLAPAHLGARTSLKLNYAGLTERLVSAGLGYLDSAFVLKTVDANGRELAKLERSSSPRLELSLLVPCTIPLAAQLLCTSGLSLLAEGTKSERKSEMSAFQSVPSRARNRALLLSGMRFKVLSSSLPFSPQEAWYEAGEDK